ncbi:MAG: SDR family NAD(P)-dependent oxidoreductase [Planctomycetaceae bacterium]|nr:SDR family NAD(P)-dependent oxidoreductase [Planctomycetaceae bacterium]
MSRSSLLWTIGGIGAAIALRAALRSDMSYTLRGKTALITGGSRGLGLLIARELARHGAHVALCARDEMELRRAVSQFVAVRNSDVTTVVCDLTVQDDVDRMVDSLMRRWNRIDVLVNNAGIIQVGPVQEMTLSDYQDAMAVHFWAPLYAVNAVLPQMLERREGRIVNISSIGGKISVPHLLPYCASKFALVGLSQGLRAELAGSGVQVTTVCPGLMRTGSPRHAQFKGRHRDEHAWFSISDSLPLVAIDAERAARRIVAACRRGDPEIMVSWMSRTASTLHGLFPGTTSRVLGWANRLLPRPGGVGVHAVSGSESDSRWSPSLLTLLSERAAWRNNEVE